MTERHFISKASEQTFICLTLISMGLTLWMYLAPQFWENLFSIKQGTWFYHDIARINSLAISWLRTAYKTVNFCEGNAWILFGILVLNRCRKNPAFYEILYSLSFIIFGVSDYIEINHYPIWLGSWKVINVWILLYFRSLTIRTKYPQAKVY
jgi:hypothetical protein